MTSPTATDLYHEAKYPKSTPQAAHPILAQFAIPDDVSPVDVRSMIYRAFEHLAMSLADRLPNSQAQLDALKDLHVAMASAVKAADGDR